MDQQWNLFSVAGLAYLTNVLSSLPQFILTELLLSIYLYD